MKERGVGFSSVPGVPQVALPVNATSDRGDGGPARQRTHHKSFQEYVLEFRDAVQETFRRGGNVLIPAFAVERAQELIFIIRELRETGDLPYSNVFLDSPMAINITDVIRRHPECFDDETKELFRNEGDPFHFPGIQFTKTPEESRRINDVKSNAVIIAGSGMMTGGRILHHLKHNVWRKESSIVFVGYQSEGTLCRKIIDGERDIRIFDQPFRVRSRIYTIGGFSSHAGRDTLIDWISRSGNPSHVFLVHGEGKGVPSLRNYLLEKGLSRNVHIPRLSWRTSLSRERSSLPRSKGYYGEGAGRFNDGGPNIFRSWRQQDSANN